MNEELNKLITEMRMKEPKLKKYIFMDRNIEMIWSFNKRQEMDMFLSISYSDEFEKFVEYNNGKIIVLPKQEEE